MLRQLMFYSGYIFYAVWLSSPVLQAFLLAWAMRRKLFDTCPIFFWYLTFAMVKTAILFTTWQFSRIYYYFYSQAIGLALWNAYFYIFEIGEVFSTLFAIAILYELYSDLFRNHPGFSAWQDKLFRWSAGTSIVVSAVVASIVPATNENDRVMIGVLTFGLASAVMKAGIVFFALIISSALALRWSYYAFGILAGIGLFATVDAASVAARLYGGEKAHADFALIKSGAYACTMLIWVIFYVREPRTASVNVVPDDNLASWNQALVETLTR